jgi:hypothetical protein
MVAVSMLGRGADMVARATGGLTALDLLFDICGLSTLHQAAMGGDPCAVVPLNVTGLSNVALDQRESTWKTALKYWDERDVVENTKLTE